jgi:hypothetical protein
MDFAMERGWLSGGFNEIPSMQKLWWATMLESESSYHGFRYAPSDDEMFPFSRGSSFPLGSVLP